MNSKRATVRTFYARNYVQLCIVLAWCLGLVLGLHIISKPYIESEWEVVFSPRRLQHFPVLLLFTFAPLGLTLICIQIKKLFYLPILCLIKSVLFGFSLSLIGHRFSSGSWLAALLFLFADVVNICLLLWFWLRYHGAGDSKSIRKDTTIFICILFSAFCFDWFILTPFLKRLF